jgi:hypothetical protein
MSSHGLGGIETVNVCIAFASITVCHVPLRPDTLQMLVSHEEKSSITSGPHGPPVDWPPAPVLVLVLAPPVPVPLPAPPVPVVVEPLLVLPEELLELDAGEPRLTQMLEPEAQVRPVRQALFAAHGHFS